MKFCRHCQMIGICERLVAQLFSDRELYREYFLYDFRAFLVSYTIKHDLCFSEWLDHLCDLYRDYRGRIKGADGQEVFLDMSVFEVPHIREWFRDFIRLVPPGVQPRLRPEARERVRVLATIMRANFPSEGMMWGLRAANDNAPAPLPPCAGSGAR